MTFFIAVLVFSPAVYLRRLLPQSMKAGCASVHELLHKRPPNLSHLRAPGSIAFVHDFRPGAFNATGICGEMIGYIPNSKMCRILLDSGKLVNSADVTFHETLLGGSGAFWTLPGYGSRDVDTAVSAALEAKHQPQLLEAALTVPALPLLHPTRVAPTVPMLAASPPEPNVVTTAAALPLKTSIASPALAQMQPVAVSPLVLDADDDITLETGENINNFLENALFSEGHRRSQRTHQPTTFNRDLGWTEVKSRGKGHKASLEPIVTYVAAERMIGQTLPTGRARSTK